MLYLTDVPVNMRCPVFQTRHQSAFSDTATARRKPVSSRSRTRFPDRGAAFRLRRCPFFQTLYDPPDTHHIRRRR